MQSIHPIVTNGSIDVGSVAIIVAIYLDPSFSSYGGPSTIWAGIFETRFAWSIDISLEIDASRHTK